MDKWHTCRRQWSVLCDKIFVIINLKPIVTIHDSYIKHTAYLNNKLKTLIAMLYYSHPGCPNHVPFNPDRPGCEYCSWCILRKRPQLTIATFYGQIRTGVITRFPHQQILDFVCWIIFLWFENMAINVWDNSYVCQWVHIRRCYNSGPWNNEDVFDVTEHNAPRF